MKRYFFAFFFVTTTSVAFSQGVIKIEPFVSIERSIFPSSLTIGDLDYQDPTASTLSDSPSSSTGFYFGTGAILEYPISKKFSLRGGIAYANRHFEAWYENYAGQTTFRLSYLDIPVTARYYLFSKRFFIYTDAGITTSARVHNETVVANPGVIPDNTHLQDVPFNGVMLMSQLGMGAGLGTSKGGISLTVVYRNGLTKFVSTDDYRFKSFGAHLSFFRVIGKSAND